MALLEPSFLCNRKHKVLDEKYRIKQRFDGHRCAAVDRQSIDAHCKCHIVAFCTKDNDLVIAFEPEKWRMKEFFKGIRLRP